MHDSRIGALIQLVDEIQAFRFCSPSDDPEEQTSVVYGFKHLVKQFLKLAKRIQSSELQAELTEINPDVESIYDVYDLNADIQFALQIVREIASGPVVWTAPSGGFIDPSVIDTLRAVQSTDHDLSKLIQYCEELNGCYRSGYFIACSLLIRSIINHVPPIFGQKSFASVVSQATKSRKELFSPLEEFARDVGDLHSHDAVRHKEVLPTRNQVMPFQASIEVLLNEIVVHLSKVS